MTLRSNQTEKDLILLGLGIINGMIRNDHHHTYVKEHDGLACMEDNEPGPSCGFDISILGR
jgi:hypothetical protein